MRHLLTFAIVTLLTIGAAKCDQWDQLFHGGVPQTTPANQQSLNDVPAQNSDVFDDLERETFQPYRKSRHDEFDWSMTKFVLSSQRENTILSPFLVKMLLSILGEAAGENTSTRRELQSILPSLQSTAEIRELYGKAFSSLLLENSNYQMYLGARLYVDRFIEPLQRFHAIIKAFYQSDVVSVDFNKPVETAALINAWCSNATKNHITNIVNPEDVADAVIMLLNTIYFNGYWRREFSLNQTTAMNFHLTSKSAISVPFMTMTNDFYYFESTELNSKILRLPFKGYKFAMYIVLPYDIDGLDQLVGKIDSSTLHRAQYLLEEYEVKIAIPKFRFTNSINLNEALKQLGIRQMFTNEASFALLTRGQAYRDRLVVSNVLQKTGIEVNEKGSTAFAATQISLTNKFGGDFEFICDRPFLFLIEDESTGTLIFSGKVLNPAI